MEEAVGRPLGKVVKEDSDREDEFIEMLESRSANAFVAWEAQRDEFAGDARYLALSTNAARLAAFNKWKATKASSAQPGDEPAKFIEFVHSKHEPRMLYAQFKRRFRTAPEFQCQLSDREKEKLFREYVMASQIRDPKEQAAYIRSNPAFALVPSLTASTQ